MTSCDIRGPGSSALPPARCDTSRSPPSILLSQGVTVVSDIDSARKWLQDQAPVDCKDRDALLTICWLLQKRPAKEDQAQWQKVLTAWKSGDIKRQAKNEKGQWRNRSLTDIKIDAESAAIRCVSSLAGALESGPSLVQAPQKRTSRCVDQDSAASSGAQPPSEMYTDTGAASMGSKRMKSMEQSTEKASGAKVQPLKRKREAVSDA